MAYHEALVLTLLLRFPRQLFHVSTLKKLSRKARCIFTSVQQFLLLHCQAAA